MQPRSTLGDLDRTLLLALMQCGGEAYGVELQREIEERTGRSVSAGALYTALARLQAKKFVRSRLGEATAKRGGRRKRYFALAPAGEMALETSLQELRSLSHGLEPRFRLS